MPPLQMNPAIAGTIAGAIDSAIDAPAAPPGP
jgi:hypothetical protein